MADDEEDAFKKVVSNFNLDEAGDKIVQRTAGMNCPCCGVQDWLVESGGNLAIESGLAPVFISKDPRGHWGPAPFIATIAIFCSNCGFIRLHNVKAVLNEQ